MPRFVEGHAPAAGWWRLPMVLVLAVALASGCARWGRSGAAESRPARSVPHNTVTDTRLGAELVVTATVTRLITINAFVLQDADLPPRGLLVVVADPAPVDQRDLVTVRGRVELFEFRAFAPKYGLSKAAPYIPFQGRRILVADDVRSWA